MLANPTSAALEDLIQPVKKKGLTKPKRAWRLIASAFDIRAWVHLIKLVNYYNYTHVMPRRAMTIGQGAAISPTVSFANAQNIAFGDNAHLGAGCSIWAGSEIGHITAGDNLLLGPGVVITAANYRFDDGSPVSDQLMDEKPIMIGDDVWIGANAVILPGASVGKGAIIAAGAVIHGDVADGAVMAGVPAKPIRQRASNRP